MNTRHDFEKNYAIIIGINNYAEKPLRAAKNDAEKLAKILGSEERKEDEQYKVLLLTDEQATHGNLSKLLEALKEGKIHFPNETVELKEKNRLLIYFSGHGLASSLEDSQKVRDEAEKEKFLNNQYLQCQDGNKLPLKDFFNALQPLNCRHLLLILDCCFAGQAINNTGLEDVSAYRTASFEDETEITYERQYQLMFKQRAWTAITSSGYEEALDSRSSSQTHSYFAQALFKALDYNTAEKSDSNKDDIITDNEIFTYLKNDKFVNEYQSPQKFNLTFTGKKQSGQYFFLMPDFEPNNLEEIKDQTPYQGLFAYETKDAFKFRGRNKLVKDLFKRVYENNQKLTVVIGASGSGKSSLVKAGLIAKIEKENRLTQSDTSNNKKSWKICEPIRPGEFPFKALIETLQAPQGFEKTNISDLSKKLDKFYDKLSQNYQTHQNPAKHLELARNNNNKNIEKEREDSFKELINELLQQVSTEQNLLLFIDQFEELVTLCQPLEREYFLKLLAQMLNKSENLRLVLTVRSDFEIYFRGSSTTSDSASNTTDSDISQYWNKEARLVIDEMNIDELRQVIEKPARLFGVDFESDELVNNIIDDVRGMPGALALLSFTLEKLYDMAKGSSNSREPITIKNEDYKQLGGVEKALTNKATEVYEKLGQKIEEKDKGQFTQEYEQQCQNQNKSIPTEDESAGEVRQAMMKQLMIRMVTTQGGSLAKRPVSRSELQYPEWRSRYKNATYRMCQVIDLLIKERLIVSNSYESKKGDRTEIINYIEPAHDALILYWDKLSKKNEIPQQEQESQNQAQEKSWLEEQEEILALRHRLIADVQEWQEHKQDQKNNKCIDWIIEKINFAFETDTRFNLLDKIVLGIRFVCFFPAFVLVLFGFIIGFIEGIFISEVSLFSLLVSVPVLIIYIFIIISIGLASISPRLLFLLLNKVLKKLPYLSHRIRSNETAKKLGKLIWDKDLRLEQVRQFLYSKDSWLNKGETEFVRQSVIEKQRTKLLSSTVREIVGTVIVALGVVAFLGYRQANLKKTDVLIKSAEEKLNLNNDLNATIDILHAYKILDKNPFLLSVFEEKNEVKKTMNRVFYEVRESNKIQVNRGNVYHMALSPDGTKLVTVGEDDTVILWNTSTGKQLDQFQTEQNEVWSLAFSPDSQLIATGGDDGTVKLWEIDKNDDNNVKPWKNNDGNSQLYSEPFKTQPQIYSIAFIKDKNVEQGKYKLATIGEDDTVTVWDISSGDKEGEIKTGQEKILSLAFNSQNNLNLLAIVGGDNKLRICKLSFVKQKVKLCNKSNNKEYIEKEVNEEVSEDKNILYSVAFTDDGKIATGGKDGKVKLWEIDNSDKINLSATQPEEKEIQQGTIYSLGWSSTNKGTNKLATLGADGTVILRDPSGKEILPIRPLETIIPNTSVAISPDGEKLATANEEGWVQLWDDSGKRISRIRTGQKPVNSVVFSPNPNQPFIVTGGKDNEDGTLKLWDMAGNELDEITQPEEVMSVVFNPQNNKQLGTFGTDGTFKVWEISKDKLTFKDKPTESIETQITQIKSAVFTPDTEQVITLAEDGTVQLWQDPQQPETLLENFPVDIKSLALSPKGEKLAIGGNDGTVWVWNGSAENEPTRLLQTQQGSIDALAYISNDKFATVGEDGTLRVWETAGKQPIELSTTEEGVRSIAFSSGSENFSFDSDSTTLATVGEDGTVSLFDTSSLGDTSDTSDKQPTPIPTQSGVASSVALSPDGNWLVIGEKDGKVKLLNTSGNQLGEIPLEQGVVTDLSFSSNDKLLVTIEKDNQRQSFWLVTIYQTGSSSNASNPTFKLSQRQLCFDSVALSDDGTLVAVVNQPGVNKKGIVKVYSSNVSLESLDKACREKLPEQTEEFPTQQGGITSIALSSQKTSIALSSQNSLLATAGEDGSLRLGNTKGTQFDKIPTLQGQIKRVVFSPDGTLLATIGKKTDTNKTTLKLWKISEEDSTIDDNPFNPFKSLRNLFSRPEQDYKLSPFKTLDNISNVAFSPDGKFLATLATEGEKGVNGKVRLWKLGTDEELFTEICNWAKDYLKNSPSLSTSDRQLCDKASNSQNKASNSQ